MRTTIIIDDELLGELMQAERGASRSEAIRRAVHDYLRRRRLDEFMELAGSRLVDLEWRDAERQELDELRQMESLRRKRADGRRR